jgi:DNA-binding winged helix-turn-helix (wHTH) protein
MGTENPLPLSHEPDVVALRFGQFELDLRSGEMRRAGVLMRLQPQPFKVLAMLACRPGELVTREEIQKEVWPAGTFVDFEQSLNFCIRQIRSALGDSALSPRFVETLPRRGYRFNFGPVETVRAPGALLEWRRPAALMEAGLPLPAAIEAEARPARPRVRAWALAALALVVIGAGVVLALRASRPEPVPSIERLTFRRGSLLSGRFTWDGQVLYGATFEGQPPRLFLSRIDTREMRPTETEAGWVVGVSRQGEFAFLRQGGVLARAPLAGGPPKDLLDQVMAADWNREATEFAVVRRGTSPLKVEYPVGTVLTEALWPADLRISPDGQRVAFLERPILGDDRGRVIVVDRQGHRTRLTEDFGSTEGLAWSPKGDEIYFTAARVGVDSALHAVTLDGRLRTVMPAMGRLVLRDISPDGRFLLERVTLRHEVRFRRIGEEQDRDLTWMDASDVEDLSEDGGSLLIGETGEGGGIDYSIFLRKTDGSLPVRVGPGRAGGLSPDGRWVLAIPLRNPDHIELLPTGAGEVRTIRNPGVTQYDAVGFVGDGKTIYFTERMANGRRRTMLQDLAGGPPRPAFGEGVWIRHNTFSPDGRFAVHDCNDGSSLCLFPVGGGDPKPLAKSTPGYDSDGPVAWDRSGRLYLGRGTSASLAIDRLDLKTGRREKWAEVRPADLAGVKAILRFAVAGNGSAYAFSYERRLSDLYVVDHLR